MREEDIDWEAFEKAFREWLGRNDHALSLGGCGDLRDLFAVLNAARAKSVREKMRARRVAKRISASC